LEQIVLHQQVIPGVIVSKGLHVSLIKFFKQSV